MYNNIHPQYTGNIMNIGGAGYNQDYYGNTMNRGYFNPYLYYQQQKALEAQMREEKRRRYDVMKSLLRKSNKSTDNIEEYIKQYDVDYVNSVQNDINEYNKFIQMHNNHIMHQGNEINHFIIHSNNVSQRNKENFPDDMSMLDYFDKAGEILLDITIQKSRDKAKDVSKLYNRDDYLDLIKLHKGNIPYFNTISKSKFSTGDIDIDDMEVTLPNELSDEYYKRKRQFLESIFK